MKEIHLIRHAESEANAAIDVDNPTNYFDAKITEKGKLQAQIKHEEYKGINFDVSFAPMIPATIAMFLMLPFFDLSFSIFLKVNLSKTTSP